MGDFPYPTMHKCSWSLKCSLSFSNGDERQPADDRSRWTLSTVDPKAVWFEDREREDGWIKKEDKSIKWKKREETRTNTGK